MRNHGSTEQRGWDNFVYVYVSYVYYLITFIGYHVQCKGQSESRYKPYQFPNGPSNLILSFYLEDISEKTRLGKNDLIIISIYSSFY